MTQSRWQGKSITIFIPGLRRGFRWIVITPETQQCFWSKEKYKTILKLASFSIHLSNISESVKCCVSNFNILTRTILLINTLVHLLLLDFWHLLPLNWSREFEWTMLCIQLYSVGGEHVKQICMHNIKTFHLPIVYLIVWFGNPFLTVRLFMPNHQHRKLTAEWTSINH